MKCTIPEISWHNREPVLSVDIHPVTDKFYRLATGGADTHVLIWQMNICDNGAVKVDALSDLTRHQKAINCVKWSPTGQYLATADDDANIITWQLKTDNIPLLEGESGDKEVWIVYKVMRGHKEDIYDLCWSPNGLKLLSGSVDNTAILWDFSKFKSENILTDHKGFVQGVSWDPFSHYIATISTDRVCRIFDSSGKHIKARIQKGLLPVPEKHYLYNKEVKFFHDDTFKSFFRRLDFSPEGTLLAVPSGRVEDEDSKKILNATYLFAVNSWAGPVAILPTGKQCSTVARFCPILFDLQDSGPEPILSLPFRMVVAVGTDHDVILYDTQQQAPFAYFRDIHYTRLTDLTWSSDGLLLVASSTDGFCALITFEPDELGVQHVKEESELEDTTLNVSGCEELDDSILDISKEKIEVEPTPARPKKPNLLEKWAIKTPKKSDTPESKKETPATKSEHLKEKVKATTEVINKLIPRRIAPIAVKTDSENVKTEENHQVAPNPIPVRRKGTLFNFLKTTPKSKSKDPATPLQSANVILDEIEARDAWKCEKEEPKSLKMETTEISEHTSDFSLHLDDSNVPTNKTQPEIREQTKDELVGSPKTTVPKRRIPLITLSSPKQKKK